MKFIGLVCAAVLSLSLNAVANEKSEKEVQIGINGAFVPAGFDSSSDVYVIVNGVFPNGCYRWSRAEVTHHGKFAHQVKSFASVSQGMCIMVLIPFQKEVRLGKFAPGKHMLRFESGDGTYLEKELIVE